MKTGTVGQTEAGLGYSPLVAGMHFLPMTATPILVATLAGLLADRIGPRPVMVVGMLLLAIGLRWVGRVAGPAIPHRALAVPLIIAGAGVPLPFATAATASLSAAPPEEIGKAPGATNTIQRFGGAFGAGGRNRGLHRQRPAHVTWDLLGRLPSCGTHPAAALALLGALAAIYMASKRTAATTALLVRASTAVMASH